MKHIHLCQLSYSTCTVSGSPQCILKPPLFNFPTATISPSVPESRTIFEIYRQCISIIFTLPIVSTASCSFLIPTAIISINCCVFQHSGCISPGPGSSRVASSVIGVRPIEFSSARPKLNTTGINVIPEFIFLPTPFLQIVAYWIVL